MATLAKPNKYKYKRKTQVSSPTVSHLFTGWEKILRLEDIASALHLTKAEVMSKWETRSGAKGFLTKFLVGKANHFWDSLDFHAFEDILALLIYGCVVS